MRGGSALILVLSLASAIFPAVSSGDTDFNDSQRSTPFVFTDKNTAQGSISVSWNMPDGWKRDESGAWADWLTFISGESRVSVTPCLSPPTGDYEGVRTVRNETRAIWDPSASSFQWLSGRIATTTSDTSKVFIAPVQGGGCVEVTGYETSAAHATALDLASTASLTLTSVTQADGVGSSSGRALADRWNRKLFSKDGTRLRVSREFCAMIDTTQGITNGLCSAGQTSTPQTWIVTTKRNRLSLKNVEAGDRYLIHGTKGWEFSGRDQCWSRMSASAVVYQRLLTRYWTSVPNRHHLFTPTAVATTGTGASAMNWNTYNDTYGFVSLKLSGNGPPTEGFMRHVRTDGFGEHVMTSARVQKWKLKMPAWRRNYTPACQ